MRTIMRTMIVLATATLSSVAWAQSVTVDHLSQSQLLEKGKALGPTASASGGSASAKLSEYPNHYTMVALRKQTGGAEIHEKYADFFYVLQGQATLTTGGSLVNSKETSPGEFRGTAVKDGSQLSPREGDFVHVPANVPHQLLLADGSEFVYFVIKVAEK